jgi:hypothetical protein
MEVVLGIVELGYTEEDPGVHLVNPLANSYSISFCSNSSKFKVTRMQTLKSIS